MVIGYHVILGAHGFWLPNDPRGSYSTYVWAKHLRRFGPAQKVDTRRSIASKPHDRALRLAAKTAMKFPAVRFTGLQALAIADGFASLASKLSITLHAFAIMPDHLHFVLARRRRDAEEVAEMLKRAATRELNKRQLNPMSGYRRPNGRTPSPWGEYGWIVYIDSTRQMNRAIEYVNLNPEMAGLKRQKWGFVVPYRTSS